MVQVGRQLDLGTGVFGVPRLEAWREGERHGRPDGGRVEVDEVHLVPRGDCVVDGCVTGVAAGRPVVAGDSKRDNWTCTAL